MGSVLEEALSIQTTVRILCHLSIREMRSTQTRFSCHRLPWTGSVGVVETVDLNLSLLNAGGHRHVPDAASLNIEYPMLFKVENRKTGRSTHCGVLEFIADEGHMYLPYWVSDAGIVCTAAARP